ncbi:hypothetical protein QBC37DRAFT_418434 [Rhypophila decipiens]|uniref:CENP-V/GFA domain-containing protein n=1 Tax=Rhypophila decipiens TaxID=261697 RepID=A0AAN7B9L2_9PEZI|nr:hypothetical protein QBC37DRAFT_418434 [Rhypophila decipiens]
MTMATLSTCATCAISCHCGAHQQTVEPRISHVDGAKSLDISVCHCYACRHVSGQMFASWVGIEAPGGDFSMRLQNLDEYTVGQFTGLVREEDKTEVTYYFCRTCGCHVLRSLARRHYYEKGLHHYATWQVATGVMVREPASRRPGFEGSPGINVPGGIKWRHVKANETKDGGLCTFLSNAAGHSIDGDAPRTTNLKPYTIPNTLQILSTDKDELKATCHCGNITLGIRRPYNPEYDEFSTVGPRSNFPDLMYPYKSTPESVISNPDNVKWWLTSQGPSTGGLPTRYLAGTCACRSCRLTSGFEIQSWAFIPRENIRISVPLVFRNATGADGEEAAKQPLRSYESSPGVIREFCPGCGATVFWHDKSRPDLIDVSVGLFRFPGDSDDNPQTRAEVAGSGDGARHESWLDWWTDRVSFAEDAALDRAGFCSLMGKELVGELEKGLKEVGGKSQALADEEEGSDT